MTEIYVTGVVIANGIPDTDGDVLTKKEIKQLLTKYTHETDTMHTYIKNEGVEVIENWITETPTIIGGKTVPAGSWLCTSKVTNSELIDSIFENKLNGYSLGSVPQEAYTEKYWFINKSKKYSDFADIENIKPLFISFVDKGANGYTFEVLSYEAYINKNDKTSEDKIMSEKTNLEEEKVSISALEKIKQLFINKSDASEIETIEPITQTETPVNETNFNQDEFLSNVKNEVSAGVVEGLKAFAKEQETANAEPVKEEEKEEEPIEEPEETEAKKETEPESIDDVKINKRQTQKLENIEMPEITSTFYSRTGRDSFGVKIKK
ncbi:XkdF-like putative serine protease domain-containing protein [Methanobrevibacter sp.]